MRNGLKTGRILQLSVTHFIVDFACIFFLYRYIKDIEYGFTLFLIYNFCAFALQMPFGLLTDYLNKNILVAFIGCMFIAMAYGLQVCNVHIFNGWFIACCLTVLVGVGNAFFHIGAGVEVLNASGKRSSALGIFVSPGALGIYLGSVFSQLQQVSSIIVALIVSALGCMMLLSHVREGQCVDNGNKAIVRFQTQNVPLSFQYEKYQQLWIGVGCLFLVVCLRSYLGMVMSYSWKNTTWSAVIVLAVILGKLSGGMLADIIGVKRTTFVSLGAATILFLFSDVPIAGVMAVFFFNMTMPITLWLVARVLHKSKGFAFGLLTFGLFIGYAMDALKFVSIRVCYLGYAVIALCSMLIMLLGISSLKKKRLLHQTTK